MKEYKKMILLMKRNPTITDNAIKLSMPLKDYIEKGWADSRHLTWNFRLIQTKEDILFLIDSKGEKTAKSVGPINFENIPNEIFLKKELL